MGLIRQRGPNRPSFSRPLGEDPGRPKPDCSTLHFTLAHCPSAWAFLDRRGFRPHRPRQPYAEWFGISFWMVAAGMIGGVRGSDLRSGLAEGELVCWFSGLGLGVEQNTHGNAPGSLSGGHAEGPATQGAPSCVQRFCANLIRRFSWWLSKFRSAQVVEAN